MPSQGSAGFLSGFQRSLFPGLNRGAEMLAGGWQAQDQFAQQSGLAAQQARARRALAIQKQRAAEGLADKKIAATRELEEQVKQPGAMARTERSGKDRITAAKEFAGASRANTQARISEQQRQSFEADLIERKRLAREALEKLLEQGPPNPEDLKAIDRQFFGDMPAGPAALKKSGKHAELAGPRRAGRTAAEQDELNAKQHGRKLELESAKAGVKLLSDSTLKYTDPATYQKAKRAADRLLTQPGAKLSVEDVRAAGSAFEKENGRPPANAAELETYLGKGQ